MKATHKVNLSPLIVTFVTGLMGFNALHASSQEEIRYYEKISDNGVIAVWSLIAIYHTPDAPNEPSQPGDFAIPPGSGGGYCDPATGICYDPNHDIHPPSVAVTSPAVVYIDGDCDADFCEVVTASPVSPLSSLHLWVFPNVMLQGGGGGGVSTGRLEPDETSPDCNPEEFGDTEMEGVDFEEIFSDPDIVEALQQLVDDSNFNAPIVLPPGLGGRVEQVGFLIFENGEWDFLKVPDDIGAIFAADACMVDFGIPPDSLPDTAILVHTHPWSQGQDQTINPACSNEAAPYESLPGDGDVAALIGTGVDVGIILDKDGIILFDSDYEDGDPVETEDRNCF